ncbi:MAG: glutamate--tRNA ligase [Candidatus Saganbacteria bacterium]|nr:glutamate--tRNA ligase [Candidatus Saganbacteria bacterium]
MSVRVRFAPSPTGALHLGGARTALFNWVYARIRGGKFILRIEDTDKTRSTKEAVSAIFDGLRWLGLDWDEGPGEDGTYGPYYQTKRLELYKKYAEQLLAEGSAYYCICPPEELEKKRKEAAKNKLPPKYDNSCRKLTPEEAKGKNAVVRFKLPEGVKAIVYDLLRDKVEFEADLLDDFVIMKSDGFPTYNFACVVDDHLMEISHVIRGDDHLSNTPRQILLCQSLGWKLPKFAHIPMILGEDGSRLSKRHGATSAIEYEKKGYLPEAMFNYLARLGWGYRDQEIFSREELVKKFTIKGISKNPAKFDLDKLNWLNGQYIRKALPERIIDLCLPYLEDAYDTHDFDYVSKVVRLFIDRIVVIPDIVALSKCFFTDDYDIDSAAVEKHLKTEIAPKILGELKGRLEKTEPFTKENIEPVFKTLASELGLKLGQIIHPCRVALTGTAASPPMYDVVEVLGKNKVLNRLKKQ